MATPNVFPANVLDTLRTGTLTFDPVQPGHLTRGAACAAYAIIDGIPAVVKRPDPTYRDSNRRELAAAIVSRYVPGLVNVPPTAMRADAVRWPIEARGLAPRPAGSIESGIVAMAFIPDSREVPYHPLTLAIRIPYGVPRSDVVGIATFDRLIGNPDRHPGNILWADNRLWAIDHGRAFTGYRGGTAGGAVRGHRTPAYVRSYVADRLIPRFDRLAADLIGLIPDGSIDMVLDNAIAIRDSRILY